MLLFICYPKCGTCRKARQWLDANGVAYQSRDIQVERPTPDELRTWQARSGLPARKWFNTSGQLYKTLNLKDALPNMSDAEQLDLLASDGLLVKRPILVGEDFVLSGFKETAWRAALGL